MKNTLRNQQFFSVIGKRLLLMVSLMALTGMNAQVTSFPWTETFEDNSPTRSQWTQIYEVNNMSWTFTTDASTGSYDLGAYQGTMFANYPATSHNFDTTKLVSPVLNMAGMSNVTLEFYYVNPYWGGDQNRVNVYYRTSSASPWVEIATYHEDIDDWTSSGVLTLPNPTATYQIAIECWTDYGYSTLVDQVVVNGTTSSVSVTGVDVTTQGNVPAQITTNGGTLQLNAAVAPAAANQAVTWSVTSGSAFGSVNASGLVTATANGSITVRATSVADPTKFDDITVTVNAPIAVISVQVDTEDDVPAEITTQGGTLQLEATINPAGANQNVTWSIVSGSGFGSLSADGLVTGTSNGIIIVRATSVSDPTKSADIDVTVNIAVTGVEISTQSNVPATITTQDGTLQLVATVNPTGASQDVTWSVVSGGDSGSVDADGTVTGTANGTIVIRATSVADNTKFDDITITITIAVSSVEVTTEGEVAAAITTQDGTLQLEATVNPSGADQDVTWSVVSGGASGSVDADGTVTGTANGTIVIRATSVADDTKFDDITITITIAVESVEVSTEGNVAAEITAQGGNLQLEATVNPSGADQEVTWSVVSGGGFGSVDADGNVTGTANGTIVIRATSAEDDTLFDDITITIDIAVESVDVSTAGNVAAEITTQGGTLQLEAVVNPEGVGQDVTWSIVSGGEFGSVDADGTVTATANGTIVIRATSVEDETIFEDITITITGNLATGEFSITSMRVYPNPVTDVLHISATTDIKSVEIYDMPGQLMTAKTVNGTESRIDIASYASGNYIVKINAENASKTIKIVKQ